MNSSDFITKILMFILTVVISLILSLIGLNTVIIFVLIGFLVSYVTVSRLTALTTGVAYTLIEYFLTYTNSSVIASYIPSELTITSSTTNIITRSIYGLIIPELITIIVVGLSAMAGYILATRNTTTSNTQEDNIPNRHYYNYEENSNTTYFDNNEDYGQAYEEEGYEQEQYEEEYEQEDTYTDMNEIYDPISKSKYNNKK
ncbi:MAG: hypothetical protein LUG89_05745 [Methanosphaera sp.]|nr:hypothetical protein [Methanosphaera sp.]